MECIHMTLRRKFLVNMYINNIKLAFLVYETNPIEVELFFLMQTLFFQ